jgi:RNA polymerase sigma factor (sigma-70 family)
MTACELIEKHSDLVWNIAHKLSNGTNQVDDLAQSGFLALVENAERYDESRGAETTFVHHVSRNAMLKEIVRTGKASRKSLPIEFALDSGYSEEHLDLEDFVGRDAEPDLRRVVTMKYKGLTHREVASSLGISNTKVAKLVKRAKRRIEHNA